MLAQMMSLELGEYGIRTNCVNPTGVVAETGIGHGYWDTERSNRQMKLTPMGRFAGLFIEFLLFITKIF